MRVEMRVETRASLLIALSLLGCGRARPAHTTDATPPAPPPAPAAAGAPAVEAPADAPRVVARIDDVGGTAYPAARGDGFWIQDASGEALVSVGLDGRERSRLALEDDLEEAALWIRTSGARRPASPDGTRLLALRSEPDERGRTAFVLDVARGRETALPVPAHAEVDGLADGRLLVVELGEADQARPAALLDPRTGKRTPLCRSVAGLRAIAPTRDGAALIVTADQGTFLTDLACKRLAPITPEARTAVVDNPARTAWLVLRFDDQAATLELVGASPRTIGPAEPGSLAWLDDDRFVFVDAGQARWARGSSPDAPRPVTPAEPGCQDTTVSALPAAGAVVVSRRCGEGRTRAVVLR